MSLTNYTDLQASLTNWLKRDDLTANIPDFIALAEAQMTRDFINMNPPPRAMETTATGTLSGNTIALPTGYLGTKRFQIQINGRYYQLTYKTSEQMANYSVSGRPSYYCGMGDNLEIAPPPDSSYAYSWVYYKKPDSLAIAVNGVNWVLSNNPDLYLYASLLQSAPFLKNDNRLVMWAGIYKELISSFEMANRKDRQSGSTPQIRSDVAF